MGARERRREGDRNTKRRKDENCNKIRKNSSSVIPGLIYALIYHSTVCFQHKEVEILGI